MSNVLYVDLDVPKDSIVTSVAESGTAALKVLGISWETQQRLCSRLTHFTKSGKARNKAIVALARELAVFI